jgi:hypothetical protein
VKLHTWDEIWEHGPPLYDVAVGPYRIGIQESNLHGPPIAAVAFFREDMPGQEGEWVFCGEVRFALPRHPDNPGQPADWKGG